MRRVEDPASSLHEPTALVRFYDEGYTQAPERAALYARWRALGARGKADHVIALCRRAGLWAGGHPITTLEVGCGDGALLSELHARGFGGALSGVEITRAAVEIARTRPEIEAVELYDGERLPFGEYLLEFQLFEIELFEAPAAYALEGKIEAFHPASFARSLKRVKVSSKGE